MHDMGMNEAFKRWIGKNIRVYVGRVVFQGTLTDVIGDKFLMMTDVKVLKTKTYEDIGIEKELLVNVKNVISAGLHDE